MISQAVQITLFDRQWRYIPPKWHLNLYFSCFGSDHARVLVSEHNSFSGSAKCCKAMLDH